MSREPEAYNVQVKYRDAEPERITLTGGHPDGEYWRDAEYVFRVEGATAVLKQIDADGIYQVHAAEDERVAVHEAVAALPFVQAVQMFPEVDA